MASRSKQLTQIDPVIYREFNATANKFQEITPEEREVKSQLREEKIKEIENQKKMEEKQIEEALK